MRRLHVARRCCAKTSYLNGRLPDPTRSKSDANQNLTTTLLCYQVRVPRKLNYQKIVLIKAKVGDEDREVFMAGGTSV